MTRHFTATAVVAFLLMLFVVSASSEPESQPSPEPPEGPRGQQSTQRVYIDPVTGQLTSRPAPGTPALMLSQQELEMLNRSDAGLIEQPVVGGGVLVDLRGRFRHMATATIGPDGTLRIRETTGENLGIKKVENDLEQQ